MLIQNDVFEGYHLPKGSIIMANIYAMCRDPQVYRKPNAFAPERFIAHDGTLPEPDPRASFFGFGRRICPGRHLADMNIWLSIAISLATLSIRKARDPAGIEVTPEARFVDGTIVHPAPFECDIQPRCLDMASLLARELTQYPRDRN